MSIRELQTEAHAIAVEHGWYDDEHEATPHAVLARLALIHSEISEATEDAVRAKMKYNRGRPYRHGRLA